jgi:cytoskeletal protein CcmA (bactofilin family)
VGGTLAVTGNTSLSILSTSGSATLNSASITNNATVGGTLAVTGNTSLSTLSTSGIATLNSASITNNATVGGTLAVTGATSLNGGVTVSGGAFAVTGPTNISNSFQVAGATTLNGPTTINNTLNVNSGATLAMNGSTITLASQGYSGVTYADHPVKNSITVGPDQYYTNKDGVTTTVPYGVIVTGRMYVDGDLAVNGYLTGTNATSSTGIVVNNSGVTVNGLTNSVSIVANGSGSAAGDRSQLSVQPDNLSLTVLNPATQEAHGLTVNTQSTTLSGGTRSTSLILDDNGATFRNDATQGPARVTGVADGTNPYDAVNYRQLVKAYSGVASAAALAGIPDPGPGKRVSLGIGGGTYMGEKAVAVGLTAQVSDRIRVKTGFGYDGTQPTVNGGISFSW